LSHYGVEHQLRKSVEELTELSLAIQRVLDGRANIENVLEEIADVRIMLAQLELVFGDSRTWMNRKLLRLARRIGSIA
jgi:hypothetical protein